MTEVFINGIGWIEVPDALVFGQQRIGKWDKCEERILAALYPTYGLEFTARALNRHRDSVSGKASDMGVEGRRPKEERGPIPDTLGRVA